MRRLAVRLALPALLALAGCRDSSVVSYRIPKEADPVPKQTAAAGHDHADHAEAGHAHDLTWTAPASWRAKSGSAMRKGSYAVGPDNDSAADLAITAFPGDVGGELANVNRWRGQISLPPIDAAELPAVLTRFEANGLAIAYLDIANGPQRMLAAFVPHEGATWFVKLTGPDAVVAAEKPAFVDFLNTLKP